jgi:hypothetical protein
MYPRPFHFCTRKYSVASEREELHIDCNGFRNQSLGLLRAVSMYKIVCTGAHQYQDP